MAKLPDQTIAELSKLLCSATEKRILDNEPPKKLKTVYDQLDQLNDKQMTDVILWIAEHSSGKIDPVILAIKHVNALKDVELTEFMTELKNQFDPELWELLI